MKRTKNSLKKIKLLLFLMLMTIIISLTATYAWFSSQRDVDITGIKLNVEVAESMQISLDGDLWLQSITIDNMRQFYGTYSVSSTHQANKNDNTNYVPTELKPVSTIGEVANGKLQFMKGEAVTSGIVTSVTATPCSETDLLKTATITERETGNSNHSYLVFDMYLRNYSAKESDNLQLNKDSRIWVSASDTESQEGKGKEGTGLENCVRVGFVVYENTADITASSSEIRSLTSSGTNAKVSIWEPNDLEHIQEVIYNSSRGVTANATMPTYGIKHSETAVTLTDIEATSGANIAEQKTMKPTYSKTTGTISATNMTDINNSEIMLQGNKITKVRVYIWLEGQDVDCINTASQGDRLQASIKLTKPINEDSNSNTYTGEGSSTGGGSDSGESGTGGETEPDDPNIITAQKLTTDNYGGYVTNYTPTNGVNSSGIQWRIFYSDSSNIYLISDTYVGRSYIPNGRNGVSIDYGTHTKSFGMSSIINDTTSENNYQGWEDLKNSPIAQKWLSKYALSGYTSTHGNMKATAYLLDANQWSGFKDSTGYAKYAIGSPTIELFAASYNQTHASKGIDVIVSDEYGYKLKWSTSTDYSHQVSLLDTSESLYISYVGTTNGLFMASPSAKDDSYIGKQMNALTNSGYLQYNAYEFLQNGVRPIICLESNVKLEKQADGTYLIVE